MKIEWEREKERGVEIEVERGRETGMKGERGSIESLCLHTASALNQ